MNSEVSQPIKEVSEVTPTITTVSTVIPTTVIPTTTVPTIQRTPTVTPTVSKTPTRLNTGTILKRTLGTGTGTLEIDNKVSSDTIMSITNPKDEKTALLKVYIKAADKYTISNIPDGVYRLFYVSGEDWNDDIDMFNVVSDASKFDDSLTYDQNANYWSATLYPVVDGNALTTSISASEFPK